MKPHHANNFKTFTRPVLGYVSEPPANPFALRPNANIKPIGNPTLVEHLGEAMMLLIGQTGSGKTLQLIANALAYAGTMIILDIGGDICRATYRFRKEILGQTVYVLDAHQITGKPCDRLDPLDQFSLPTVDIESGAENLAGIIMAEQAAKTNDAFWPRVGSAALAGDVAHAVRSSVSKLKERRFTKILDWFFDTDVPYRHAVLLDTEVKKDSYEFGSMSSWLQLPDSTNSGTRSCVVGTVQVGLAGFRSEAVRSSLSPSTVDLNRLLTGAPTTVYIVIPIEQMYAMSSVLRLWLDTLLQPLMRRARKVEPATLVVVDEAAQVGRLSSLLTLATYGRNRSTRLYTAWQDAGQIRSIYDKDFSTLVNNCSALLFNAGNYLAAADLATLAGVSVESISRLKPGQQLVVETGIGAQIVELPRYYKDPFFRGRFDPLPRFEPEPPYRRNC